MVKFEESSGYRSTPRGVVKRPSTKVLRSSAKSNQQAHVLAGQLARQGRAVGIPYNYTSALSSARAIQSGKIPTGSPSGGVPRAPSGPSGRSRSGWGGGWGGGGGGGGGGIDAKKQAQMAMDYMARLLASSQYTASPDTAAAKALADLRGRVGTATREDLATLGSTYNDLDRYLKSQANVNPYGDVKLTRAQVAPNMNPYLATQGVAGLAPVVNNPDDSYGGFTNALKLLGANFVAGNQSGMRESQMARAFGKTGINAQQNAYLSNLDAQQMALAQAQTQRQDALNAERRQTMAQLIDLIAQGATAPDLAKLGIK
jgi:hypothetical protein